MIDSFHIGAYWKNRKEFLENIISPALKTLKGLSDLDEQFLTLYELGNSRKQALENEVSLTSEIIKKLYQEGVKKNDIDQDGYNKIGYNFSVWTGHEDGKSSKISFRAGSSSERVSNVCLIKLPYEGTAKDRLLQLSKVKEIMKLIIQNWNPDTMILKSGKLSDALGTVNEVGWVTYTKNLKGRVKLNNKVVHEESFCGGHLFYLKTENGLAYDYSLIDELIPITKIV